MKIAAKRLNLLIVSVSVVTIILTVMAGVEPSPFREIINKINSIENKLESVENQMEQILFKSFEKETDEDPLLFEKKLDDLADVLCDCQEKIDSIISVVPDEYRRSPVLMHSLFGIELESRNIINCIDQLYTNPDNISIAQERVKFNGQIVMYSTRTYTRRLSDDINTRTESDALAEFSDEIPRDRISVDEDGFIVDPSLWSEKFAAAVAASEGVDDLTGDHWKVVNFLRDYYIEYGAAPMIRRLCESTGFKLKKIYELFPSGPAKGACKIAGLPKPTGCV